MNAVTTTKLIDNPTINNISDNVVVSFKNVSKKFCKHLRRSLAYGFLDLSKNLIGFRPRLTELRRDEFWALDDVSFNFRKCETLGIIGPNGSGKTTLLRLLSNIFPPDKGEIAVSGKVGALIAVGTGFHPHLTGRENIFLNGAVLGISRKEIEDKFNSIVEFADIGDFLDSPVATYSSGMRVRLGFSIAIHADVNILLVDEVLAVGDLGFQLRCFNKIGELRKKGLATIIVSHNMHSISTFCDRVIVLNKGRVIHNGSVEQGIQIFKSQLEGYMDSAGAIEKVATGSENFEIREIKFSPSMVNEQIIMRGVSDLEIFITFEAFKDFFDLEIDISIRLPIPSPIDFFQASNKAYEKTIDISHGKGIIKISIRDINLNNFRSYLYLAIWERNREKLILWWRNIPVIVQGNSLMAGWGHFNIDYYIQQDARS